ncbi:adult-specific rigid cuticular protein 11.9-like [Oppia nitens]|uniref:adult-specific rigid cuticular protein 11.9-like n=1 Tax=Oppia nitens TaxID=1686743 RepID=UPI0023DAEDD6|nr:adult-specific rigid cuticular protein 11.9-like [Oppia nitens]
MKSFIVLSACIALSVAQFGASGPYSFGYQTADGQSRQESGHGGAVQGSYSYVDANGDLRQVRYVADANGYRAEGDVSVDKRTAAAAAQLAAIAPKAPIPAAPVAAAPVHYSSWQQPAPAWNQWNQWAPAAPLAAHLAQPVAPWAVPATHGARAAYKVETPTHSIYSQI